MTTTSPALAPSTGVAAARSLALVTLIALAWSVVTIPARAWLQLGPPASAEAIARWFPVDAGVGLLLSLLVIGATSTFATAYRGTPVAALAWASVGTQGAGLLFAAVGLAQELGGVTILPSSRTAVGLAILVLEVGLVYAAEALTFLALRRALPRPAPALVAVFWGSLGVAVLLFALGRVDAWRALLRGSTLGVAVFAARQLALVAREAATWVAARRVAREGDAAGGAAVIAAGAAAGPGASARGDLVIGAIALGIGVFVTVASYAMASGAGGGRYVVATGAVAVGVARLARGMWRLSRGG